MLLCHTKFFNGILFGGRVRTAREFKCIKIVFTRLLAPQKIDFSMEIAESTAATRGELTTWGFVCLGAGALSLVAAYLLNKQKQPVKKRR